MCTFTPTMLKEATTEQLGLEQGRLASQRGELNNYHYNDKVTSAHADASLHGGRRAMLSLSVWHGSGFRVATHARDEHTGCWSENLPRTWQVRGRDRIQYPKPAQAGWSGSPDGDKERQVGSMVRPQHNSLQAVRTQWETQWCMLR